MYQSLSDQELFTVDSFEDKVVYSSKRDRLNNQVIFEFGEDNGFLEVSETLYLPEKTNSHLLLK